MFSCLPPLVLRAPQGKDVTFQCSRRKGFKLCVINEATTAFATFKFTPQFFETYRVGQDTSNHDDDNEDDDLMMDDDDDEKDDDDNNTGHGQVSSKLC